MRVFALLLLLAATYLSIVKSQDVLPEYMKVCYRDDTKVADCIKERIETLLPMFKNGSTDFELESLDPMTFKNLVFSFQSPLAGGVITIPSVASTGLSALKVLKVRPRFNNPEKFILDFDVQVPKVRIKANYNLGGNVLQATVKMNGHVDFNLFDVTMRFHISGDVKPVDGKDYIQLKVFRWRLIGEGVKNLQLLNDNLVQGKPALNRLVITLIKSSWRLLKDSMIPTMMPATDKIMTEMFVNFFKKYPYDVILPKLTKADTASEVEEKGGVPEEATHEEPDPDMSELEEPDELVEPVVTTTTEGEGMIGSEEFEGILVGAEEESRIDGEEQIASEMPVTEGAHLPEVAKTDEEER